MLSAASDMLECCASLPTCAPVIDVTEEAVVRTADPHLMLRRTHRVEMVRAGRIRQSIAPDSCTAPCCMCCTCRYRATLSQRGRRWRRSVTGVGVGLAADDPGGPTCAVSRRAVTLGLILCASPNADFASVVREWRSSVRTSRVAAFGSFLGPQPDDSSSVCRGCRS